MTDQQEQKFYCIHGTEHTRKDLDKLFKITSQKAEDDCWFKILNRYKVEED